MGCLYRFNRLFNVSKTRALVVAVLCLVAGFTIIPLGADFGSLSGMFFMWSLIYGVIWFVKFQRDLKLHSQITAAHQQPPVEQPVRMANPDSYRLIVPQRPNQDNQ